MICVDTLIDGDWIVSRSTHYGGTSGGACGYGNIPNCYIVNGSSVAPSKEYKNNFRCMIQLFF